MKLKNITKTIIMLLVAIIILIAPTNVNAETNEVIIKSITPEYDTSSSIITTEKNGIYSTTFNDKNQTVKYKVVIENTQDYDVRISSINLSTPSEKFLSYSVEGAKKGDILKANSTKELAILLETTPIEGWGRNFSDKLTANVSFDRVETIPPVKDTNELTEKTEEIKISKLTNNSIEFETDAKLEKVERVAIWLYSEPTFLGYFNVQEEDGIKKIEGLEAAFKKIDVKSGEYKMALVSDEGETVGYVNIYIGENNELFTEKPSDEEKIENPFTSANGLVIVLMITAGITLTCIFVGSKNKIARYSVIVLAMGASLTLVDAQESIELPITIEVNYKSQNVMKKAGDWETEEKITFIGTDYWEYADKIKTFNISNEIKEIKDYAYKFDVSENKNEKVLAYLVTNKDDNQYYDLYLQADGIIYPNPDANHYFYNMLNLDVIKNLELLETSSVTNMSYMFEKAGYNSTTFTLDLGDNFDTSNVTDMYGMFAMTGYGSPVFELNLGNKFDTSKVTNMNCMFNGIGYSSKTFTLDLKNKFDTSKVTDMHGMFAQAASESKVFNIEFGDKFDTRNVTDMSYMFNGTGNVSTALTLDLGDKFDTTKVEDTSLMFAGAAPISPVLNVRIAIQNPNIKNYAHTFFFTAVAQGSKVIVDYTDETEELVNQMINTKYPSSTNVKKGQRIIDINNLKIGDAIFADAPYRVVDITDEDVKVLYIATPGTTKFSDTAGWEYAPGPKEIDLEKWSNEYLNKQIKDFETIIKDAYGDNTIKLDILTLQDLEKLGCTIQKDYSFTGKETCKNSPNKEWLTTGFAWWTKSARSDTATDIWYVNSDGSLLTSNYNNENISVVFSITVSKEMLKYMFP